MRLAVVCACSLKQPISGKLLHTLPGQSSAGEHAGNVVQSDHTELLKDGDDDEGGGGGGDVPGQTESATDNASADDDSSNI